MTSLLTSAGESLTDNEKKFVRVFVRLVEKAKSEYMHVREYVVAGIEEEQRTPEEMARDGRPLYVIDIADQMENCLNAVHRLYKLLDAAKSKRKGLQIDRLLRRKLSVHYNSIKIIRGAVEHIENKIQAGWVSGPVMLFLSDDGEKVTIANDSLRLCDLAKIIREFQKLAIQWLDDFCKKVDK
jgi:tRNA uridine 5-carbamoylmethylation protein Kti12